MSSIIENEVLVTVVGTTDYVELMCVDKDGEKMKIDPFVGCAIEAENDQEVMDMIGKTYTMNDYWFNPKTSCWVCFKFDLLHVNKEKS